MRRAKTEEEKERGEILGKEIQRRRLRQLKTGEQFAVTAGISVDTLRSLEQGRVADPGVFVVAAVAAALECEVDALVAATNVEPD